MAMIGRPYSGESGMPQGGMPGGMPQGRMPQGGSPQGGQGGMPSQGGKPGDAITAISDSIMTLADAASKSQPTTAKALAWLNTMFGKIMDQASQGGVKDLPEMDMESGEGGAKPAMDMSQGVPMGMQGGMR